MILQQYTRNKTYQKDLINIIIVIIILYLNAQKSDLKVRAMQELSRLYSSYPRAPKCHHGSLTINPQATTDEFNVIPKTNLTSFPAICRTQQVSFMWYLIYKMELTSGKKVELNALVC